MKIQVHMPDGNKKSFYGDEKQILGWLDRQFSWLQIQPDEQLNDIIEDINNNVGYAASLEEDTPHGDEDFEDEDPYTQAKYRRGGERDMREWLANGGPSKEDEEFFRSED